MTADQPLDAGCIDTQLCRLLADGAQPECIAAFRYPGKLSVFGGASLIQPEFIAYPVDNARRIFAGSDTAATEFFQTKTSSRLSELFKPVVQKTMSEVGVTKQYQTLTSRLTMIPFVKAESLDLDQFVVDQAMRGLFFTLAEEEKKIRTNPAARVTSLLKEVFGGMKR